MNDRRDPLSERLRAVTWRPLDDDTRRAQVAAIEAAVEAEAARPRPVTASRRRFATIAVAAALLVLPAGIAFAAEDAVPGDVLYPVKRVTETLRSYVDSDIAARHRVEELEHLVAADAPRDVIRDQVDRATAEVDRLVTDHPLRPRLAGAAGAITDRPTDSGPGGNGGSGSGDSPPATTPPTLPPDTTTTTAPTDRSTTTTSVVDTTTTTIPRPEVETHRVFGVVRAGPTCPVERFPPDPECEDQPVAGARLVVADADGKAVETLISDDDGRFHTRLPNGAYTLIPQPYDGLLGTAPEQDFLIDNGPVELLVGYDTGIR